MQRYYVTLVYGNTLQSGATRYAINNYLLFQHADWPRALALSARLESVAVSYTHLTLPTIYSV